MNRFWDPPPAQKKTKEEQNKLMMKRKKQKSPIHHTATTNRYEVTKEQLKHHNKARVLPSWTPIHTLNKSSKNTYSQRTIDNCPHQS
jgi:hypothetical protein